MHFSIPEVIWQCQGLCLTHHLTFDIVINKDMCTTNNRRTDPQKPNYIALVKKNWTVLIKN